MSNVVKCAECGTMFNQADWWNCTKCNAPSPDLIKARKREAKPHAPAKRHPSTKSLRSLLP